MDVQYFQGFVYVPILSNQQVGHGMPCCYFKKNDFFVVK